VIIYSDYGETNLSLRNLQNSTIYGRGLKDIPLSRGEKFLWKM